MDKLAKVRAEVERLDNEWYLCNSSEAKYKRETYKEILDFINSLQQEPVNEDLEKAEFDYAESCKCDGGEMTLFIQDYDTEDVMFQTKDFNAIPNKGENLILKGKWYMVVERVFSFEHLTVIDNNSCTLFVKPD